jgi:signal transduction histidine kinase
MVAPSSKHHGKADNPLPPGNPEARARLALELLAGFDEKNPLTPEFQEQFVNDVRSIFQTSAAGLLIIQDSSAELVLCAPELDTCLHFNTFAMDWDRGLLERAILSNLSLSISGDPDSIYLGALLPAANLNLPSIICAPVTSGEPVSGAVFLLYRTEIPVHTSDPPVLELIARAFGNHIQRYLNTRDLRAAVESLEISRSQLLHSRNVLRALFDSFPDGLYIIDREYILTAVNMQRAMRAHRHPNLLVGRHCYRALFGRDEPCLECRVRETLTQGEPFSRSRRDRVQEDEYLEWDIFSYPIHDGEGQVVQAILLEQDITEKRRLELTLAQSVKLAAMGQWAASLAHEINNPLTAIIANAQLLKREIPAQDDKHELVDLIARAGERANQVVRNLLDLARKEEFLFGPTDVNQTIQRSLDYLQHELVVRSINLVFEPAETLPLITASPDHLQSVWLNLLSNAMDSIEDMPGEIRLLTTQEANEIHAIVADNGKGIPADKLARIFEPFYTTKALGHGTGLGLAVCQRIIQQHGGRILVESLTGAGTQFTVILPVS